MSVQLIAQELALKLHSDKRRPNKAQEPYSVHISEVARLVADSGGTDIEVAAAWLHDSVEDTPITIQEIRTLVGDEVAGIVEELTDLPDVEMLEGRARKALQAERMKGKSESARRIKIADQTSNLRSVALDPPVTWSEQNCIDYIEGSREVVSHCMGISPLLDSLFEEAYANAKKLAPYRP